MCTVTILPIERDGVLGVRIGCNRDEAIGRPVATGPRLRSFGGRRAIMPCDPTSGGTWIAVNNAGVAMILLNRNPSGATPSDRSSLSRGTIIPSLLHCGSLDEAVARSQAIRREFYAPFRLILLNCDQLVDIDSIQPSLVTSSHSLSSAQIFTSSGLGDEIVRGPRTSLFNAWFGNHDTTQSSRHTLCAVAGRGRHTECACYSELQDDFHQHYWLGAEQISVHMRRTDARTVSYTAIRLFPSSIHMSYRDYAREFFANSSASKRIGFSNSMGCVQKIGGAR